MYDVIIRTDEINVIINERFGFGLWKLTMDYLLLSKKLHFAMSPEIKNFLILLLGIIIVLLIILLLGSGKSNFKRGVSMLLADSDEERRKYASHNPSSNNHRQSKPMSAGEAYYERDNGDQKYSASNQIEMVTLVRKSDDRLRVIESTGQVKLMDEFYQLVFKTRKGRTIKVECSRAAYEQIPFNQQGSLTFKKNTLVKFKYFGGTIYNQ